MSERVLIAEFHEPEQMLRAAQRIARTPLRLIDAYSPFPIEGLAPLFGATSTRLRVVMFCGGAAFAATAYALEFWSAVIDYPINSGGRPLNSWPAFVMFPFAVGIFGAALIGLIALLVETGLPRLHHPLFALEGFERATQDRFMLALARPQGAGETERVTQFLERTGAVRVWEIET